MRLLSVLLLFGMSGSAWSQTYTISTFAGGALPVNIPGMSASLGYAPRYLAADQAGDVFFVYENTVLRLDAATNVLTLVAGTGASGFSGDNGPATSAQLNGPTGLAVDSNGSLYIADTLNNRIREVSGGVIATVAGTGTPGFGGDKGQATSALLNGPTGVAVDSNGILYIADTLNRRVRQVASTGVIATVAGGGTSLADSVLATKAQLATSIAIAVDPSGILYIADTDNNRVRKVSTGVIATVAGTGTRGFSGDNGPATGARLGLPSGIALDPNGNLYIADTDNNRIREVSNGVITTVAGGRSSLGDNGPATSAQIVSPTGVAVDSTGDLFIADFGDSRIRKVSNAVITTVAGNATPGFAGDNGQATSAELANPYGLAIDAAGNLYIADSSNNVVRKVANGLITTVVGNGSSGFSGDNGPAASAQLNGPSGVAVDSAGNLYIADTLNNVVRKVSAGVIATVAGTGTPGSGGDNGPPTSAQLYAPSGIAVDSSGNLYIADSANNRIRLVSGGVIATIAGTGTPGLSGDNGPAINAQLYAPSGIAVDSSGNLFIADTYNGIIREISNGVISTVAGNGTLGYAGDNGPALRAQLNNPYGIAVDSVGNLYIADTADQRIRKVSSSGTIATVAGNGTPGFSGDSGPAPTAQLNSPYGLTVDSAGKVYIADYNNNRVRLLTPVIPCAYSVSPATMQAAVAGGSLTVGIKTTPSCSWTVTNLPAWITVSGASSGTGSASVTLVVAPNSGASVSATILIGGASLTVTQPAASACIYALSPGGVALGVAGGTGTINVSVSTGCPWAASTTTSWITITGGSSGNGNGTITFQAAPNPGAARSGAIMVAGLLTFKVEESDALVTGLVSAGTITHLASGGYWTTTITLVNTSPSPAQVRLSFFDNNGNPLALPLSFPQSSSAAGTLLASTLDRTLQSGAELVVQSTGPNNQPTLVGWAQVLTNGVLGGSAILSQAIGNANQEAEMPLDTSISADYVVPFDNTNGASTALALTNISPQPVSVTVSINNDSGSVMLSNAITLPAMGHTSFTLADRYGAVTAQRRGTVEFTTPSTALISVIGLRFNATGAFSTIPTIAK